MLLPNTILQNRYRIVRSVGQGGMGTVYEALDQRVNAIVAIKETNVAMDERARREFEREAGLLANLQHQALPKVMDYFVEGHTEYLVMEHISGYDLLELLNRRGGPFHVNLVMQWAEAVLDVLEYLHERQPPILHRDIKPANLKLTKQEELFLIDFGIAKGAAGQMATLLTNRSACGYTPVYSPLEQVIGKGTDPRSDLYSLGATLYHLLTGVPPTDAATRYELLESGQSDPLLPIQQLNPKVPPGVAGVIRQSMAIARKDRYESATTMRQALNLAEDGAKQAVQEKAEREVQRPEVKGPPVVSPADPWRKTDLVLRTHAGFSEPPAQPPIFYAPARRKTLYVLSAVGILAVAAIVIVFALTRRTSTETGNSANQTPGASPRQTVTGQPGITAGSATPLPSATPPTSITENLNGVKLELVLIPGGSFTIGSPAGEGNDTERPAHQVTVQTFYMSKYEVTQAQWQALMRGNPSNFSGDSLPVEQVSWEEAVEFCKRLSAKTGREYRLPSEAEWEYACRAGTSTPFAFGTSLSSAQANFDGRAQTDGTGVYRLQTTPVGSFPANKFGLYDMHGNVWEWCLDIYHKNYNGAPTDGTAWLGASGYRVIRGGSWLSVTDGVRSAVRDSFPPDQNFAGIGFRVVAVARR